MTVRVVICDDHRVLADALASLLSSQADIDVVAVASSIGELAHVVRENRPDVVLMDYELPDGNGIDGIKTVLDASPESHVVMLTSFTDDAVLVGSIEAGATGFVTKHSGSEELAAAIHLAAAGESAIAPGLLSRLLPLLRGDATGVVQVTEREREILALLAGGASNQMIADALHLSPNTVRNHLARIYARLGARSRLEAVAIAYKENLLTRR